jgi:hypothetical protein
MPDPVAIVEALRAKHAPVLQHQGRKGSVSMCAGCMGPHGTLPLYWPCDVIRAIEAYDEVSGL